MSIPSDRVYTKSHEWIRDNGDGTATIGITAYAQDQLGEVVYYEPPEVGDTCEAGDQVATIESVKAVSDVYTPISGEIASVNEELEDSPEVINDDPYDAGWMFTVTIGDPDELEALLDSDAYQELVDSIA
ncbi:MAG: glycine cleavage system protein GcvH [Myxococcota bacterium]